MSRSQTISNRRIDITLPEDTLRLIDRVAQKGDRSRLVNEALKHYLGDLSRAELRKKLKEGALARAERDRKLTREWFFLEEEMWPKK